MRTYLGTRGGTNVLICDLGIYGPLDPRMDLARHAMGFAWGSRWPEPAQQLAVAVLADALKDDDKAKRLHLQFHKRVIAELDPAQSWSLSVDEVLAHVAEIEKEAA